MHPLLAAECMRGDIFGQINITTIKLCSLCRHDKRSSGLGLSDNDSWEILMYFFLKKNIDAVSL